MDTSPRLDRPGDLALTEPRQDSGDHRVKAAGPHVLQQPSLLAIARLGDLAHERFEILTGLRSRRDVSCPGPDLSDRPLSAGIVEPPEDVAESVARHRRHGFEARRKIGNVLETDLGAGRPLPHLKASEPIGHHPAPLEPPRRALDPGAESQISTHQPFERQPAHRLLQIHGRIVAGRSGADCDRRRRAARRRGGTSSGSLRCRRQRWRLDRQPVSSGQCVRRLSARLGHRRHHTRVSGDRRLRVALTGDCGRRPRRILDALADRGDSATTDAGAHLPHDAFGRLFRHGGAVRIARTSGRRQRYFPYSLGDARGGACPLLRDDGWRARVSGMGGKRHRRGSRSAPAPRLQDRRLSAHLRHDVSAGDRTRKPRRLDRRLFCRGRDRARRAAILQHRVGAHDSRFASAGNPASSRISVDALEETGATQIAPRLGPRTGRLTAGCPIES